MATHLYLLCEGERDELVYERLAERVTERRFVIDEELRVRAGSNWKTVQTAARLLLSRFKHWTEKQDIAVIVAIDNDRAPEHPEAPVYTRQLLNADLRKAPRHRGLSDLCTATFGPDRAAWPVDVALAVPVEMIESWVLRLLDPSRGELPLFAEAAQTSASRYHNGHPPPQLKDLTKAECQQRELSMDELFLHAADTGDLDALAAASRSFALFRDDLAVWRLTAG